MSTNNRKKPVVLLIDDNEVFLRSMESQLKSDEYELATLNDGYFLFDKIDEISPSLIILDIQMPRLDGTKTCRTLKNNEKYKDIPIIISTGTEDSIEEQKVKMFGAIEYVVKPYDTDSFKKILVKHLKERS